MKKRNKNKSNKTQNRRQKLREKKKDKNVTILKDGKFVEESEHLSREERKRERRGEGAFYPLKIKLQHNFYVVFCYYLFFVFRL